MEENKTTLTDDDFREALKEFGTFVDIIEECHGVIPKIYSLRLLVQGNANCIISV